MSLDGNHVNVMSSKTWAFWIFSVLLCLQGFVLSLAGEERKDPRFENYLTRNLLEDHVFEIRDFPYSNDEDKTGYILLSVVNTLCSSLTVNAMNDDVCYKQVMKGYKMIVTMLLRLKSIENVPETCKKYACSYPKNTRYIHLNELRSMFNSSISWNGSVPDCPSPPNTSSQSQPSPTISTPAPTFSIDESPASTSSWASSSLRPSNTTVPPKTNTSSQSQPSPTISTPAPTYFTAGKLCDDKKTQNHIFLLLFSVSATLNALLIIVMLWQCRKNGRHFSATNQITEVLQLGTKDQSLDDSGSLSSLTA